MSWPVVPLGDVADTALGKMLDKGKSKGLSHVPYLRNVNVQWGRIHTHNLLTMELAEGELERFSVQRGDLLVCEGGDIGRAAIWQGRDEYIAYQKALHRIRPSPVLDVRFLRYLLEHHSQTGVLARMSTGSTIAHLPQQQLRRVPVPLPPLDEQHRIVELLEGHLSRLDSAEHGVDMSLARIRRLRESALVEAIAGIRAYPSATVTTIGDLARVTSGMTPLRSNKAFYEGGRIPWVTSGDLSSGVVDAAIQFVTERAIAETSLKLVRAGAILVAMYGEGKTRGTAALLDIDATTNQACAAIQLHDGDLRQWVKLVLDANYAAMRRMAIGGVQPNLNLSLVRSIEVPLPPESARVAALDRVREIEEQGAILGKSLDVTLRRVVTLRHAVLGAAFSGQWCGDDSDSRVA